MILAQRQRAKLIEILGGRCAFCSATSQLEIDHPNGRKMVNHHPDHRKKSYAARIREYWMEFASGIALRLLCKRCNSKDGRQRQLLAIIREAA
jgi:hypothetical protein